MGIVKHLYVYMLKCTDGSYYTGVTNNPAVRLEQHNTGINSLAYTYTRRPVEMVYCEKFSDFMQAIDWEKKLKKWSKRKKEALMENNFTLLKELAECRNESHHKNMPGPRSS